MAQHDLLNCAIVQILGSALSGSKTNQPLESVIVVNFKERHQRLDLREQHGHMANRRKILLRTTASLRIKSTPSANIMESTA